MSTEADITTTFDPHVDRKRQPGGYIWREKLGDAETYLLDAIVAIDDATIRAKLRKALDIMRELEHYRGGGD
jgi:hypothetical protein